MYANGAEERQEEEDTEEEDALDETQRLQHLQSVIAELKATRPTQAAAAAIRISPPFICSTCCFCGCSRSRPPASPLPPLPSPLCWTSCCCTTAATASKTCVFFDLQPYLLQLLPELRMQLLQRMRSVCGPDYSRSPATSDDDDVGARIGMPGVVASVRALL